MRVRLRRDARLGPLAFYANCLMGLTLVLRLIELHRAAIIDSGPTFFCPGSLRGRFNASTNLRISPEPTWVGQCFPRSASRLSHFVCHTCIP